MTRRRALTRRGEPSGSLCVLGYCRVSTLEQGGNGASLEGQRRAIVEEIERRGWTLLEVVEEVASGKAADARQGLQEALARLERGDADALIVAKLDRLTRSLLDFASIIERAEREGWLLIVVDQGFDLSTPHGRAMAGMLAVFAQFEREMISARTRDALAVKRAQGIHTGRRSTLPPEVVARVRRERAAGSTLQAIADRLNHDQVPTGQGGECWRPSSVRTVAGEGR
jgi:DNA invertase Pin-like site-specific DNA recombinase